jgi:hypothetical protein
MVVLEPRRAPGMLGQLLEDTEEPQGRSNYMTESTLKRIMSWVITFIQTGFLMLAMSLAGYGINDIGFGPHIGLFICIVIVLVLNRLLGDTYLNDED